MLDLRPELFGAQLDHRHEELDGVEDHRVGRLDGADDVSRLHVLEPHEPTMGEDRAQRGQGHDIIESPTTSVRPGQVRFAGRDRQVWSK